MANPRARAIYEFEDFRLDAAHRMLYRGEEEIALAPKAIETLVALVERPGEIVGKDELMRAIWTDTTVEESNLSQYLHILRKTLGNRRDGKPFIETLKRRGYRFSADVRSIENPPEENSDNLPALKPLPPNAEEIATPRTGDEEEIRMQISNSR